MDMDMGIDIILFNAPETLKSSYYYYPHFIYEETEALKRLGDLPKVKKLRNSKARIQTR